jgi:hypothetical protein
MALTGSATPVFKPGSVVTFTTGGAVAAGALVEITADLTVSQAAAASVKVVGVALQTSSGAGDQLPVQIVGYIFVMKAKGAVAAGDPVGAASDGSAAVSKITPAAYADLQKIFGMGLQAIADGATGWVLERS